LKLSIIKRNLQREYIKNLIQMVVGPASAPPDARSLARLHLKDIGKRIDSWLANATLVINDTSRAHLDETRERISKALNASIQVSEP
jgi:hypothetical protein